MYLLCRVYVLPIKMHYKREQIVHQISGNSKESNIIGMVRRNLRYLDINDFKLVYNTYIRPHLEFCIQACLHISSKDIEVF